MKRQNIEQIIRELFRENYRLYPESYTGGAEAMSVAKEVAKGYYDNRAEFEVERDEQAGVTAQDYDNWILDELAEQAKIEQ